MKNIIYMLFMFVIFFGCSKSKDILFCEGVSPKGEGVNCGVQFSEGEFTAVIKSKKPFTGNKIEVQVFEVVDKNAKKLEKMETIPVDVRPGKTKAYVNLALYREGMYKVTAFDNNITIGEADIEIVDNE